MKNTAHFQFWPARLPHELDYPQVPLFEFLETSARRYPDKPALIYYGRRISYREMWEAVQRLATALTDLGVKKGDRVALYSQNTPHFFISFLGIMRANAVVVPINPMQTERELAILLNDSGAVAIITLSEIYNRVHAIRAETGLREVIVGQYADYLPEEPELSVPSSVQDRPISEGTPRRWLDVLNNAGSVPPPVEVNHEDLALLPYTSGSTGVPKACMHPHSTIISTVVGSVAWHNMVSSTTVLATMPLFHVTGMIHSMLAPIYAGGTSVLLSRWDRATAMTAIEKYRCNVWTNISTMVVDLLSDPEVTKRDLSSLKAISGGGAPLPAAVGERLLAMTGLRYMEAYGMTETISQTHFNPPDRPKMQCLGIPHFGTDARIIDPDTREELPAGTQGEVVVNGPQVQRGYWNRPADTEEAFVDLDGKKFLRTGDIAYMDDEGYFFIVDRSKRMVNAAGFKVWPTEVEGVLYRHPAVSEACVVGVPDPVRGENVKAFIVLRPDSQSKVSEADIVGWARDNMAAYKYPRIIEFVSQLPKSGTGKILWKQMQDEEKERVAKEGYYWLKT